MSISSITRSAFVQDLLRYQGQIDLDNLSPETQAVFEASGVNLDALRRAAGTEGVSSTHRELSALFSEVDRLDDNCNSNSIALQQSMR